MHIKLYYCYIKDTSINYPKITNNLVESSINKPANKEIPILLNYLKPKKPC